MAQENQEDVLALQPWDPARYVRRLEPRDVKLSRGFLRCRPERWFPGFGTQWLPLAHSLSLELQVVEVKPVMALPSDLTHGFVGLVDGEQIGIAFDDHAEELFVDGVSPGAMDSARSVIAEYLARRLLSCLATSWSGPESSVVKFDSGAELSSVTTEAGIKFVVMVNGVQGSMWLALGPKLVQRLDGLWRRQVHSSYKPVEPNADLHIEAAQLAVPPSMLADYMRTGTVIDLEVLVSDAVTLRMGNKPWLPARICAAQNNLAFEILPGPVAAPGLPEGTTRLAIEFGKVALKPAELAEVSQVGAIWDTGIALTNNVNLVIKGETVARAFLCTYEGRFAINVK